VDGRRDFEDRWGLIRLMGEMDGLKDLMLIGSTLLILLAWKGLIRLPIYQSGFNDGVRTIASVRNTPSMKMFNIVKCGDLPLWRMTSFIAWIMGSCASVKSSECRLPSLSRPFVLHSEDVVD